MTEQKFELNLKPTLSNKNIFQPQLSAEIFNSANLPSIDLIQKMVDFDKLCFAGVGQTTSEKYAPPPLTFEDIEDGIKRNNAFFVVKDTSDSLAAVVQTFIKGKGDQEREVHLISMAIDPKYRGQGLTNVLLQGVYNEARENGLDKVTLRVDPLNSPAINKYLHEGFVILGGRKREVGKNPNVVTLAATKRLSQQPIFNDNASQSIDLEDYDQINDLAQNAYAGVTIDNGNLVMKKMSEESSKKFLPWS